MMLNSASTNTTSRLHCHRAGYGGRTVAGFLAAIFCVLALLVGPVFAQPAAKKKDALPKAEAVTLTTRDGVTIHCTYFPSLMKKEAVPVLLLHGWEGQRGDYRVLAMALQKAGHAVLAPDLRGHGQSTTMRDATGDEKTIERDSMQRNQLLAMGYDLIACKKFLIKKNNEGKLNIERLCIVASDMSCLLAFEYAVYDWNAQQLPAYKQGRDVKALVLLSPKQSFKGMTSQKALTHQVVRRKLSTMLVVGTRNKVAYSDATRLHTKLERFHAPVPKEPQEQLQKQDLFYIKSNTQLQGASLTSANVRPPINPFILHFIKLRLVNKADIFPWAERRNPLTD